MNNLAKLIANGNVTVEELSAAPELIERAQYVVKAIAACRKTLVFPLGTTQIVIYSYTDRAGEYEAWGSCTNDGFFTCFCNWGGKHQTGHVNLTNSADVFMAFENEEFKYDLKRFLDQQIAKAETP